LTSKKSTFQQKAALAQTPFHVYRRALCAVLLPHTRPLTSRQFSTTPNKEKRMTLKIEDLRIVIQVEGGIVQDICSNSEVPIQAYIVDYDTEGADWDELMTTSDGDEFVGHLTEIYWNEIHVNSLFNASKAVAKE
jgi:hypothetical protein